MGPCSCHVHLLLSEPQQEYAGRCAEAVESRSFAAFDCDANHFWQKRYYDIRDYAQFVETLRYLHRNLVEVNCVSAGRLGMEQHSARLCTAGELPHSSQN